MTATLPPIWNLRHPAPPGPLFRKDELADIRERFERTPLVEIVSPSPGGWGATHLALAYTYQYAPSYSMVWWLEGRYRPVLKTQFAQLATAIRLSRGDRSHHTPTIEEAREFLGTHRGWLLIAHNLSDAEWLTNLLPEHPPGHIIVTRHSDDDSGDGDPLRLSPIRNEELDLGPTGNPLIGELTNYVTELDEDSSTPTGSKGPQGKAATDPVTIMHTLNVLTDTACNRLSSDQDKQARDFLTLCAYYGSEEIPFELFLAERDEAFLSERLEDAMSGIDGLEELITPCEEFGLIERLEGGILIHPLVQASIFRNLGDKARKAWATAALRLVYEAFPKRDPYYGPIGLCSRLLPHALSAIEHARDADVAPGTRAGLQHWVGLYITALFDPEDAYPLFADSVELSEKLYGEKHPTVATRLNSLGVAEMKMGHLHEAKACFEKSFGICEHILGPTEEAVYYNIPDSMLTVPIRNLCSVIEAIGDVAEAQRTYERAMQIFLEVHGWNHSLVAECANQFGNSWYRLRRLEKAQNCYEKAVLAEESAANSNTKSLAVYLNNLGRTLLEGGQAKDAIPKLEHALRLAQRDLDETDPEHIQVLMNIGHALRVGRRFEEAESHLREALTRLDQLETPNDETRAAILSQLGNVKLDQGEMPQARSFIEESLALHRALLQPNDGRIIRELNNLGRVLSALDAYSQAMDTFEEALQILESRDEMGGTQEATLRYRIGRCLEDQGEMDAALRAFERASTIDTKASGPRSQNVARDAYAAGNVLAKTGQEVVALGHLTLSLDIYEELLGRDAPHTRKVRKRLDSLG